MRMKLRDIILLREQRYGNGVTGGAGDWYGCGWGECSAHGDGSGVFESGGRHDYTGGDYRPVLSGNGGGSCSGHGDGLEMEHEEERDV